MDADAVCSKPKSKGRIPTRKSKYYASAMPATKCHPIKQIETALHYFFRPLTPVDVIFDVDIRSPMYFCKNLLLLSSLSCSSFTASIRLNISRSDFWRTLACLLEMSVSMLSVGVKRPTRSTALLRLGSSSRDLDYSFSGSWPAHRPHRTPRRPLPAPLLGVP